MRSNFQDIYLINLSSSNLGKITSNLKINFNNSNIKHLNLNSLEGNNISDNSLVIIPGVGSFEKTSQLLENNFTPLKVILENQKIFKICICLGFQILFTSSNEGITRSKGINLYGGEVINFKETDSEYLVNTGYSKVYDEENKEISNKKNFFFNHKYFVDLNSLKKKNWIKYYYSYNGNAKFLSMIYDSSFNIFGMQFHPEMSGKYTFNELLNHQGINK